MGEKLIEAVRNEKCLYDVKHPDYVKVKLKDSIWKRIAEELGLKDGNEARRAWEKLRNNHRDALRRQKNMKRKSVSGADYIRPWRYQGLMEFLIPHMGNRTNKTNVLEESQHDEPTQIHSDSTENESEKIKGNYGYRTSSVESNQSSELSSTGTGRVHKMRRHKRKMTNISMNPSIEGHEEVRKLKRTDTEIAELGTRWFGNSEIPTFDGVIFFGPKLSLRSLFLKYRIENENTAEKSVAYRTHATYTPGTDDKLNMY